nr:aldehyde dehydrogenase [Salmonella sp. NCTC 7297]
MFVVLDDADLEKAVKIGVQARLTNAGQVCTAAKRFILHEKIVDQFLSQFTEAFSKVKVGDQMG